MPTLLLALLLSPAAPQSAGPEWVMTWNDEFSGPAWTGPDWASWNYDTSSCQWPHNGEEQQYTFDRRENVRLDGLGHLILEARDEGGFCADYTSGRVTTQDKFYQRYGRIEARLKTPNGQGYWPAFWMLGQDINTVGWPNCGEIDIHEQRGSDAWWTHSAVHGPNYFGATPFTGSASTAPPNFQDDFHVYTLEWYPSLLRFSVDGNSYYELRPDMLNGSQTWVFEHPFFVILNLAVGGVYGGPPNGSTPFPGQHTIDWVRAYHDLGQRKPWSGVEVAVPGGRIEAEAFDTGGQMVGYSDADRENHGSSNLREHEGVDVGPSLDIGLGDSIGWTDAGEWLAYTIDVATPGTYRLDARVANGGGSGTFHLEQDGVDLSGPITVPPTGGWQSWATIRESGIVLREGVQTIVVAMDTPAGNFNWFELHLETPAPPNCGTPHPTQRINVGGITFLDLQGNVWSADQPYGGGNSFGYLDGSTATTNDPIGGTTLPFLYQSERWSLSEYRVDLPPGRYKVTMGFAEIFHQAENQRRFYVSAEGRNVLGDHDLYATVGHDFAQDVVRYVEVTDGTLDLGFFGLRDQPQICKLLIEDTRVPCPPQFHRPLLR